MEFTNNVLEDLFKKIEKMSEKDFKKIINAADLEYNKIVKEKQKLRFYWIPQIPMEPFHVPVKSVNEAVLLYEAFSFYDLFQLKFKIKLDFCNTGGLEYYEDGKWWDWFDEDTGMNFDDYLDVNPINRKFEV